MPAPLTVRCAACAGNCVSIVRDPWHVQPTACGECPLAELHAELQVGRCRHPHAGPLAEDGALADLGDVPAGCPLAHTDLLVRGDAVRDTLARDHAIAGERARLRALLDHGGAGAIADDLTAGA